jgi:hypothetical protein
MDAVYLSALMVGVLVMLALYLSLARVIDVVDRSVKKSLALFCAVSGILTTFWLNRHPDVLEKYVAKIVGAGIAVVLMLLVFAKKSITKR